MLISDIPVMSAHHHPEVLYAHPAIGEAAVIGLPDEMWGEQVVAVVQVRADSSIDQDDLIAFCRESADHF